MCKVRYLGRKTRDLQGNYWQLRLKKLPGWLFQEYLAIIGDKSLISLTLNPYLR